MLQELQRNYDDIISLYPTAVSEITDIEHYSDFIASGGILCTVHWSQLQTAHIVHTV